LSKQKENVEEKAKDKYNQAKGKLSAKYDEADKKKKKIYRKKLLINMTKQKDI